MSLTWRDVAVLDPEFVQWVVQRFGPLPEGPVRPRDHKKYLAAFNDYRRGVARATVGEETP